MPSVLFNGPTMPKDHPERLAMLDEKVGVWRAFVGSARAVEPGSSLAADDQMFPVLTPSQLAWHGISSAVDHLDTFMALLRAGASYPLAPSTIARTGMLSGAHALWLLDGPTRTERQKRGLRLAHEELTRDRQAVRDIAVIGHSDDPAAGLAEMKDYLDLRDEWVARVLTVGEQQFGMATKHDFRFDDTTLLDTVTRRLAEHAPEDADLISAVRVVWRTYSGVAHGLRWPATYRLEYGEPVPGASPGTVEGRLTNSIEHLSMAASSMAIFLAHAVDLFEHRRRALR